MDSARWFPNPDCFLMAEQLWNKGLSVYFLCLKKRPKHHWEFKTPSSWVGTIIRWNDSDLGLTSVHQPFPHCFSHIEGDPLRSTFGQHILGCNVALFPNVLVWPHDLQSNYKQSVWKVLSRRWDSLNKTTSRTERTLDGTSERDKAVICFCLFVHITQSVLITTDQSPATKTQQVEYANREAYTAFTVFVLCDELETTKIYLVKFDTLEACPGVDSMLLAYYVDSINTI